MLKFDCSTNNSNIFNNEFKSFINKNMEILLKVQRGEPEYEDNLGWLNVEEWAGKERLIFLEEQARRVQMDGDVLVLIGIGGSNQAARAVIKALDKKSKVEVVYAGNALSPYQMQKILDYLETKSVYVNVIAKNFETLEPGVTFRIIKDYMTSRYQSRAAERIFATGTKGSGFQELCQEEGYQFLTFPENIGGRYSALSDVGLFPMAVAGIDIKAIMAGARDMAQELMNKNGTDNMAYQYAVIRNLLDRKGYRMEMLSFFEPRFRYFAKWWTQLFAESEGKDNKGLYPIVAEYSEDLHSIGQFIQDGTPIIFETFLSVEYQDTSIVIPSDDIKDGFQYLNGLDLDEINRTAFKATMKAHSEKLPCFCLTIPKIDEYYIGQLFYFFEFACYLSGRILGVNPFNQPGVENYKGYMFEALRKVKLEENKK